MGRAAPTRYDPPMRVLFSSISGVGHVNPMVPLARALCARGHEVRWAAAREVIPLIAEVGIPTEPAGISLGGAMTEYRARYPEHAALPPAEIPDHMGPKLFGEIAAPAMLEPLLAIARGFTPELLVHDAGDVRVLERLAAGAGTRPSEERERFR